MGSTLARPGVLSQPFYTPSLGPTALRRLEKTSWVGCPAYLLEVIFFVHARFCHSEAQQQQSTQQPPPPMVFASSFLPENSAPLQSPEALLHHIQAFDPIAWAMDLQSYLYLPDLTMRIALATTYKAAVYLYTSRVLSRPRAGLTIASSWFGLPADHDAVANLLIHQLSLIPPRTRTSNASSGPHSSLALNVGIQPCGRASWRHSVRCIPPLRRSMCAMLRGF